MQTAIEEEEERERMEMLASIREGLKTAFAEKPDCVADLDALAIFEPLLVETTHDSESQQQSLHVAREPRRRRGIVRRRQLRSGNEPVTRP